MKPIHILIDGSDNLGKTTVIQLLSRKLNLPVVKMPNTEKYIKEGNVEELSRFYNETLVQFAESSFIMDRGFTSTLVYSKVFKRDTDINYIEGIENKLKPKTFILTGRTRPNKDYGIYHYRSFSEDPIYSDEEKSYVDEEFCELSYRKNYHLIEVMGKSPLEVCDEIMSKIDKPITNTFDGTDYPF